jgi:hypothetical protein
MNTYYLKNKKFLNQRSSVYQTERRASDPLFKMKCNIRRRIRNMNLDPKPSTLDILGESYNVVMDFISKSFTEEMTWLNYGEWHLDHIIPLKTAMTNDNKIKLLHYTNLQPLWAKDNLKKGCSITSLPTNNI